MVLAALLLAVSGCGGDDPQEATPTQPAIPDVEAPEEEAEEAPPAEDREDVPARPAQEEEPTGAAKFTGQDRENYELANEVCGTFPPEKIASDLGISVDVNTSEGLVQIAEKYAKDYRPNFRQAVFEGCLDALPNP